MEPPGAQLGQGRRVRRHQLPHDRPAWCAFPPRGPPVGGDEPTHDALGVHRDEVAQPVVHRTGQVAGAVPLQQVQHPLRRGGQGGGERGRVPRPPGVAQPLGEVAEFPFRVVEDGEGVAGGQRAPVLERERPGEFGQQSRGELRRTAGQQAGRVPVAVLGTHPRHQSLGEFGPPPVAQQSCEVGADHGGRVVVRGLDRGVRYWQPPGAAQRVPADHRVGVTEPVRQVPQVFAGQRRQRGEAALVRTERIQIGEQGPQFASGGQPVGGDRGGPESGGVGQGFENGEQVAGSGDHRGHCV